MKKIFNKNLLLNIFIPVILGAIVGFISNPSSYQAIEKPLFSPPAILFPIVWTILYILMGIGNYLTNNKSRNYKIQLLINLIWPIIFFLLKWYLIAFIWLVVLVFFVIQMLKDFNDIKKEAFYINIPYFFWLLFAAYLNFGVYILN